MTWVILNFAIKIGALLSWVTCVTLKAANVWFSLILDGIRLDALKPWGRPITAVRYVPWLSEVIVAVSNRTVPETRGAKGFIKGKRSMPTAAKLEPVK